MKNEAIKQTIGACVALQRRIQDLQKKLVDCKDPVKESQVSLLNKIPPYHQLYITHNGHHKNYDSITEYLSVDHIKSDIEFEDAQECIIKNTIWELQLYPITPLRFYKTVAASLERAIELMLENCKDGLWQ